VRSLGRPGDFAGRRHDRCGVRTRRIARGRSLSPCDATGTQHRRRLALDSATRERIFYAALLYDAHLTDNQNKDRLAVAARAAVQLGLDFGVAGIIRTTRERWNVDGWPTDLLNSSIPGEAPCISAVHGAGTLAEEEQPLAIVLADGALDEISRPKGRPWSARSAAGRPDRDPFLRRTTLRPHSERCNQRFGSNHD